MVHLRYWGGTSRRRHKKTEFPFTRPRPSPFRSPRMSKTEQAVFAKGLDGTPLPGLPKAPTGIGGLDVITSGGLPKGRPTLVCGPAGCGKTLLAMEVLGRGAREFGEPGGFLAV